MYCRAAACRAAQELGYTVLVKDGHEDARNIDPTGLPRGVLLHRGWQNEPAAMMCGLDASYDAALYIGYHAPEGSDGSPLAHTIEHPLYAWMKLDGVLASEFSMNALWAAAMGVPSVFLSGDRFICVNVHQLVFRMGRRILRIILDLSGEGMKLIVRSAGYPRIGCQSDKASALLRHRQFGNGFSHADLLSADRSAL